MIKIINAYYFRKVQMREFELLVNYSFKRLKVSDIKLLIDMENVRTRVKKEI